MAATPCRCRARPTPPVRAARSGGGRTAGWIPDNLRKAPSWASTPGCTPHGVTHLKPPREKAGGTLVAVDSNPIDAVWNDQPAPPVTPAKPHAFNLAGEQSEAKRMRLGEGLKKAGAEVAVITLADSVCWLLNIRGSDVPHTPFTLAFAILHDNGGADLFLDPAKRTPELMAHLGNSVQVHEPVQFAAALDAMKGKSVWWTPTAAAAIFDRLTKAGAKINQGADPCQLPKACKNSLEIEGMRKAHIRDGAALARFLAWFAAAAGGELTEIDAAEKLEGFRRATGCLSDVSFDTISGAGATARSCITG